MAKKNPLNLLLTSVVVGVGLAGGPTILGTFLAGVGVNWASDILWSAWEQVRDHWLGEDGRLNDDVAQALDRALEMSLRPSQLVDSFQKTDGYKELSHSAAQEAGKTLKFLAANLSQPFSSGKLGADALTIQELPHTTPATLQDQLDDYVADYLAGNNAPAALISFVQGRLRLDRLADYFVEELKRDDRLWRSQQLVFARSYLASFDRLEQGQSEIKQTLTALIEAIQSGEMGLRPPHFAGVPTMPRHFVGRDEAMTDLIHRLTTGNALALSAEGLPGIGKTTLAVALAYHRDVLAHFKDGVLWAGLGTQADPLSLLGGWADALGRDISNLVDLSDRKAAVKQLIGQQSLLLVIDDAWTLEAAEALRIGGPNCCHLLTTRNRHIARAFAGQSKREP